MAAIDAWLVGSNLLQEPNAVLNAASPGGLPRLQFVSFGSAVMGFGDLFIAAVLGALLAADRRLQLTGAALAAVLCLGFDLLFFAVDQLPATVPIALTLAVLELLGRTPRSELGGHRDEAERSQLRTMRWRQSIISLPQRVEARIIIRCSLIEARVHLRESSVHLSAVDPIKALSSISAEAFVDPFR